MIGLLQRVTHAEVAVDKKTIAAIGRGLMVLVGVQSGDCERDAERLVERLLSYRVFPDSEGKMNKDLRDVRGGLLLVPQFTLAADTRKGRRASFSSAADPDTGKDLFHYLVKEADRRHTPVASGRFGADMAVSLTNDGPVTFWLEARSGAN